jgi:trk system potassium uptake protein TrkA
MKFCVIGLGRFGYQVAVTLAENGMEVLGVDNREETVANIRDQITQAICMHVESEHSLRAVGIEEMDVIIVAMGENIAESILITALLKKRLKMPRVITRAVNSIHKETLKLIGADEVVLPEVETALRVADHLSHPYADMIRITRDFGIMHIKTPQRFVGKSIAALKLFDSYQVYCVGIKKDEIITPIKKSYVIQDGDILTCTGKTESLNGIAKLS